MRWTALLFLSLVAACSKPAIVPQPQVATTAPPAAATATAPTGPVVMISGVSLASSNATMIRGMFEQRYGGSYERPRTSVSLHLFAPELNMFAFDGLTLTAARDNLGKALSLDKHSGTTIRLMREGSPISTDGHHTFGTIHVLDTVSPGADELEMTGSFAVRTGGKLLESKQQVDLEVGRTFTIDRTTFTIREAEQEKGGRKNMSVILKVVGPVDHIRKLEFVDGEGKILAARPWRTDDLSHFGRDDDVTQFYLLDHPVEKATINAAWYESQKRVEVPFRVRARIGLGEIPRDQALRAPAVKLEAPASMSATAFEVVDLSVVQELTERDAERMYPGDGFFQKRERQLSMTLYCRVPEPVLTLPESPMTLTSITDDLGTDLLGSERTRRERAYASVRSRMDAKPLSPDRKGFLVELRVSSLPAPGARTVTVNGTLSVPLATEAPKIVEIKNVPLEVGGTLQAGPSTLTISSVSTRHGPLHVTLRSDKPAQLIRKIEFFDERGASIDSELAVYGHPMIREESEARLLNCTLKGFRDPLSIRITYVEKIGSSSFPFTITTGIGPGIPAQRTTMPAPATGESR